MARRSKIDISCYADIFRLYAEGSSQAEIGKRYGVSGQLIGRILLTAKQPTRVGGYGTYRHEATDKHNRVVSLFNSGLSIVQIAEIIEMSCAGIYYVLEVNNLVTPDRVTPRFRVTDPDQVAARNERICIAYKFGLTIQQIETREHCSTETVQAILRTNGIEIQKYGEWHRRISKAKADQYQELYKIGYSCREIAELIGMSTRSVHNVLSRYCPELIRSNSVTRAKHKNRAKLADDRALLVEADNLAQRLISRHKNNSD